MALARVGAAHGRDSKPLLIVLIGLPGAGKTTFAKALCARERRFLHLDRDAIRARLFPDVPHGEAERRAATNRCFALARRALHGRRSVILDGMTFATHEARHRARRLARAAGARCLEVWLDTPVAVAKARIAKDAPHPARDRTPALVDEVAARFAKVRRR